MKYAIDKFKLLIELMARKGLLLEERKMEVV
jgi:hypothetical protein